MQRYLVISILNDDDESSYLKYHSIIDEWHVSQTFFLQPKGHPKQTHFTKSGAPGSNGKHRRWSMPEGSIDFLAANLDT